MDKIYELVSEGSTWDYTEKREFYERRDRALLALLYLMGCRIHEVLRPRKSQFDFDDPDFIVVRDVAIGKRKKATIRKEGVPKIDFPLPRTGNFGKFTQLFLRHLDEVEERVFKIGRKRAWAIVKHMTGKWPHYFRSQRLSYLINTLNSALVTAKIVGVKNPQTLSHYYKTTWEQHQEELKK